jgi:hypothetical protein
MYVCFFVLGFFQFQTPSLALKLQQAGEAEDLVDVHAHNQISRKMIKTWLPSVDYLNNDAITEYGLPGWLHGKPKECDGVMLKDVGFLPIQHDFISQLGSRIQAQGKRVKYLEIGVSILKGIHTQVNYFKNAAVVAWDVEDPNPTIANAWANKRTLDTWETSRAKKPADFINRYDGPSGNALYYVAGSAYNQPVFDHVSQTIAAAEGPFNLILSDAAHNSDAVLLEVQRLLNKSLIANQQGEKFAMVWDDCGHGMYDDIQLMVKETIFPMLRKEFANQKVCYGSFKISGWLGINEYAHGTCVFSNMDLSGPHLGASKNWTADENDVRCTQ